MLLAGLKMHLPARDGRWHEATVVPTIAMASYDQPETKKVSGVKDAYRNMSMFCVMYVTTDMSRYMTGVSIQGARPARRTLVTARSTVGGTW